MPEPIPNFKILSALLLAIFGGAIVGETVSLSMVVSIAGPGILGKLYLINGVLLFLLPPLFFNNIDKFNRGELLSRQLLISAVILSIYLLLILIVQNHYPQFTRIILYGIYPVSYLSKIILFLTFWTLANDICYTREAKKEFPKIAAWGFMGGLGGALLSRGLLEVVKPEMILVLWIVSYGVAYFISRQIIKRYRIRLLPRENIPVRKPEKKGMFLDIRNVLSIELVRLIAVLYFLVFCAIFLIDYVFWKSCHNWFITSRELASFQYSFFITHSIITVFGLLALTPMLIEKYGFSRLFSFLPLTLFSGSIIVIILELSGVKSIILFSGMIAFQFLRYVVFENAFSPIYQMFFAAISRKKRGRAKTFIEGVIKPSAIILAGIVCIGFGQSTMLILIIVAIVSCVMVWIVSLIRVSYMNGLIPHKREGFETREIIAEIGSHYDQKILSLMKEYSYSKDDDVRCLAVKILSKLGSKQALHILINIYENEKEPTVKEMVARSLTNFYWYEAKDFIEKLLKESNYRIRSNALHSLNTMNCYWKWRLRENVKSLLFENNLRVQIEAAQFLWQGNERAERENVKAFLQYLFESKNEHKRSAGIYLVSLLKPENWEGILKNNLQIASIQVFTRCVEVILEAGSKKIKLETLQTVENMTRKHIEITGKTIQKIGKSSVEAVITFLKHASNRRMIFEMIHALRTIRDASGSVFTRQRNGLDKETEKLLNNWIFQELKQVYFNSFVWFNCKSKLTKKEYESCIHILDGALKEQLYRVCEWALDAMALMEPRGVVELGRIDLDLKELSQRLDMVELVESFGATKLRSLVIPILEFESWAKIAKTGKHHFGFETVESNDIRYFLHSENKWICLCALFCLTRFSDAEAIIHDEQKTIESFTHSSYPYLADAARILLNRHNPSEGFRVNPFKLLETVLFFKKTTLLHNVPAEKLMSLAEISESAVYKKGIVISKEDDISDHLYIVKSGSLKIIKVRNDVKTVLSIIRKDEAYGEIGLFTQSPRSATAVANEDCEVYIIKRSSLKKLLVEVPEIAYNFLVIFSEKLKKCGEEMTLLHSTMTDKQLSGDKQGNNNT